MSLTYSRRFARMLAVASLCLLATAQHASAQSPAFSATYTVRYGVLSGTMTLELKPLDSGYVYETSLRPRGVVSWLRRGEIRETTTLRTVVGRVRPLDYVSVDTIARPHRRTSYVFDQPVGRVTGEYKSQAVDVPMRSGGHNRISAHVAIMHALQSGAEQTGFAVFDRGRWKDFEIEVIRDQFAKTPFGEFETVEIRYSSENSEKSWSLHCAPKLNFAPVSIIFREDGKVKSRAVLTAYTSLTRTLSSGDDAK